MCARAAAGLMMVVVVVVVPVPYRPPSLNDYRFESIKSKRKNENGNDRFNDKERKRGDDCMVPFANRYLISLRTHKHTQGQSIKEIVHKEKRTHGESSAVVIRKMCIDPDGWTHNNRQQQRNSRTEAY